jgi:hypothetical protein
MTHTQKKKIKTYVLHDIDTGKLRIREVKATNYIVASKKMGVTPYELRTYGHIKKVK